MLLSYASFLYLISECWHVALRLSASFATLASAFFPLLLLSASVVSDSLLVILSLCRHLTRFNFTDLLFLLIQYLCTWFA